MRPGVPTLRAARCWAASRSLHSARGWAAGRSTLRALAVGLLVDGPARTAVAAVGEREEPMSVVTASASVATPTCAVTVVPTCALIACQIGGNKAVSGQAFKSGQALSVTQSGIHRAGQWRGQAGGACQERVRVECPTCKIGGAKVK